VAKIDLSRSSPKPSLCWTFFKQRVPSSLAKYKHFSALPFGSCFPTYNQDTCYSVPISLPSIMRGGGKVLTRSSAPTLQRLRVPPTFWRTDKPISVLLRRTSRRQVRRRLARFPDQRRRLDVNRMIAHPFKSFVPLPTEEASSATGERCLQRASYMQTRVDLASGRDPLSTVCGLLRSTEYT
jgi:hypothetical protein